MMSNTKFENLKHWNRLFKDEFSKESDRASVILSVAILDQALETLLKSYLVASDSSDDKLLDGAYAPLASFSARVDICYRIGLISSRFCRDLHIIRRIRNEFAHNVSGCEFATPSVRNRIIELVRSSKIDKRLPAIRNNFPEGPKGDFQMTISWMLWQLWGIVENVHPLEARKLEIFYVGDEETDKLYQSDALKTD
jgi:DNA-binding MltR family transcriptional regulator